MAMTHLVKRKTPARRERARYRAPSVLTSTACLSSALSSTPHGRKLTSASNGRSCCVLVPFAPFPSALKLKPRVGEGYAVGGDARVANGEERIDEPRRASRRPFAVSGVLAETEEAMDGAQDTGRSIEDEGRSIEVAVEGRGPRPMYTTGSGTTNSPVRGSSASCAVRGTPGAPGHDDAGVVFCVVDAAHRAAARCARSSRETRRSAPASCTASGARRRRMRRAGPAGASCDGAGSAGGACVASRTRLCERAGEARSGASSLAGGSGGDVRNGEVRMYGGCAYRRGRG